MPSEPNEFAVTRLQHLQGFDSLWLLAFLSQDPEVKTQSRAFLTDLYRYTRVKDNQKKDITD
jgi:hypothetical protein